MTLSDLATRLELSIFTAGIPLDRPVRGGYASDLLSDVIGHARKDDVWVTMQVHPNIVAVAILKELAGVVLVGGRVPAAETLAQAEREKVPVLGTGLGTFELAGRLYAMGVKGS
jgi:hypothetical protein